MEPVLGYFQQKFQLSLLAVKSKAYPVVLLGVVKWYHSWFGAMWRGVDSLHRDQLLAFIDGVEKDKLSITMGAVVGYGGSLQESCLEGFDFLGLHHIKTHSKT